MLFITKKERTTGTYNNMDEAKRQNNTEQKKQI